jgi:multiple sugar transport system permease protein
MSVWQAGINMVIYLAALQQVPAALHEAAALDGAGTLGRFRHITWPLISPVTLYLTAIGFIASFQLFTPTYILTRGGPENATLTLPLYIYFNAFAWGQPGYAAALAAVLFLLILGLTLLQFRLARRWVFYAGRQACAKEIIRPSPSNPISPPGSTIFSSPCWPCPSCCPWPGLSQPPSNRPNRYTASC